MQTIRLARDNPRRSYGEKMVEMVMATRLEAGRSKDQILALYASHAPFGSNIVGLDAAAWRYFGHSPQALSWAESATLAVLPNSPALIHPGRNRAALKEKRDRLLRKLHADGTLTALDLDSALREPLPEAPQALPVEAPHLLETLRAQAAPGEVRFRTTLDADLQRSVREMVERHATRLAAQHIHNAAVLVIDNQRFEVLAYVGNARWSTDNEHGYAVDIVNRPRSTGSLLKPFLFAAMLDAGELLPTTLVSDVPTQVAGYAPENFDRSYRGAVPAEVALAQSLNVPMVRMLRTYGVNRFYDDLHALGMTTLRRRPEEYGLTLILGGAEGSLWDMTRMYAEVADAARAHSRSGARARPVQVLAEAGAKSERAIAISPGAAWLTLQALLEVTRPGDEAGWRNFAGARKIAWKTGTSFGLRDAWAIGTSSRYTVGVWVGNASGEGRPGLTGASAAAPLLFEIFNRLPASEWFAQPVAQMKLVEVCGNDGYLANGACETRSVWAPRESHFSRASPYNVLVHLDARSSRRVHGGCESPGAMAHRDWFVLSPAEEVYYRRHHPDYRPLPEWRRDCQATAPTGARAPLELLYPHEGTRVYIPTDLAARRSRVVFEAAHRDPEATIHWHIDGSYQGATRLFHQVALELEPGQHEVTVVDQLGYRLSRSFEVLGGS
jgi:penicillin-binding protein 1C